MNVPCLQMGIRKFPTVLYCTYNLMISIYNSGDLNKTIFSNQTVLIKVDT